MWGQNSSVVTDLLMEHSRELARGRPRLETVAHPYSLELLGAEGGGESLLVIVNVDFMRITGRVSSFPTCATGIPHSSSNVCLTKQTKPSVPNEVMFVFHSFKTQPLTAILCISKFRSSNYSPMYKERKRKRRFKSGYLLIIKNITLVKSERSLPQQFPL